MPSKRQIQVAETIAHLAADFFARESNRKSLITVTRADISPDLKNALIFITVIPDRFEQSALNFAKRMRTEYREYLKSKSRLQHLPNIDFEIDYGEKNRQRIDDLTRS
ncbi:ribosome-binding factor A [Candidatus Kaiserbacteria bacterium]|nr:ribosome-binding factor A [Candidatus Kaiserbacteria bacterium]